MLQHAWLRTLFEAHAAAKPSNVGDEAYGLRAFEGPAVAARTDSREFGDLGESRGSSSKKTPERGKKGVAELRSPTAFEPAFGNHLLHILAGLETGSHDAERTSPW